jgi:hypothetical protein
MNKARTVIMVVAAGPLRLEVAGRQALEHKGPLSSGQEQMVDHLTG